MYFRAAEMLFWQAIAWANIVIGAARWYSTGLDSAMHHVVWMCIAVLMFRVLVMETHK